MSFDYALNYPSYDYMPYGGYNPYDYNGSFTLNGNYPQPINNQTSIFNTNESLTLPAAQTTNAPTTEQTVTPDIATTETSVPAIDGAAEEKPSALEELQTEMLMTGAFMGAPMVLPKMMSPVQTANALKETSAMIDKGARGAKMADAAKTSKAFGDILNSYRLEESIKSVNRQQWQTDEILNKLKDLRTQYNEALKAKDATKMAKVAAEMDVLVKESKMPNCFVRAWNKLWKKPLNAQQSLSAITPKMAKAGQQAAQVAQAAESAKNAANTSKLAKASNWIKDANKSGGFKAMAIFEAFVEGITEVIPAFCNGGAEEGVKQTAKSTANVAASATGWCVGAKAGAWAGAAIGSFICPGVGTAIGGAIGCIVGGVLGSWGAKKAMKAVTGESFSEKQERIEKEQVNAQAQAEAAAQTVAKEGTAAQTVQPAETTTANTPAQGQGQQQTQAATNNLTTDVWLQYLNGSLTEPSKAIADAKWQELLANARMQTANNIDHSNPFAMPC